MFVFAAGFVILWLKEEKALFSSPIAYVLITVFLLIMGYSFTLALFVSHFLLPFFL